MGAWGYTIFEDDLGLDWSERFLRDPSPERVRLTLASADGSRSLDDVEATAVVVCAEIVATAVGQPVPTIPDELAEWAVSRAGELGGLADGGRMAIAAVREASELADMWAESDEWDAYMVDLQRRLEG